jgi:hypothetical protein
MFQSAQHHNNGKDDDRSAGFSHPPPTAPRAIRARHHTRPVGRALLSTNWRARNTQSAPPQLVARPLTSSTVPAPAVQLPLPVLPHPPIRPPVIQQSQPVFHLPSPWRPTPFGKNSLKPWENKWVLDEWAEDPRSDHTGFQFDPVVSCGFESFEKRALQEMGEPSEQSGFVWA